MARGDYGPEIKTAMASGKAPKKSMTPPRESAADKQRDVTKGIKEGSAQDSKLDAMPANQAPPQQMPQHMPMQGGTPSDLHHVAAATSIAHAILGRSGGGGGAY
jgi:hypothetical protein